MAKNGILFCIFFLFLVSTNFVCAELGSDWNIRVNGIDIYSDDAFVAVGSTNTFEISFTALQDDTDVIVGVGINGEGVDAYSSTLPFYVEAGERYTRTVSITLPYASYIEYGDEVVVSISAEGNTYESSIGTNVGLIEPGDGGGGGGGGGQNPNSNLTFIDYGLDTNNNGLYDFLVIEFNLTVPEAGEYEINARLENELDERIEMVGDDEFNLDEGENMIQLDFSGMQIYANGVDGSYELVELEIDGNNFYSHLDEEYETSNYNYENFERPPVEFTGNYSDYGVDTDSDGLYNYLTVGYEVNVFQAGEYNLQFNGGYAPSYEFDKRSVIYLEEGVQTISLNLPGQMFSLVQVNGPYSFGLELEYELENEPDFFIYHTHLTKDYSYEKFDNINLNVEAVDTNDNGLYDYLSLKMDWNWYEEGKYNLSMEIEGYNDAFWSTNLLNNGENILEFRFSGMDLFEKEFNGSFKIDEFNLEENIEGYNLLDMKFEPGCVLSTDYSYEMFERPPSFTGNFSDHGVDEEGDGLYDYLVVEAEVNITRAGNYEFYALLDSPNYSGHRISFSEYLEEGVQTVDLFFSGSMISLLEHGKFYSNIRMEYEDQYSTWSESYSLQEYNFNDFEEVQFRDYGIDNDGDGLYDYLVVEFNFFIPYENQYNLYGRLDPRITTDQEVNLQRGENIIQLEFSGEEIFEEQLNGPFGLDLLNIYGGGNELRIRKDDFIYITENYTYDMFDEHVSKYLVINLLNPEDGYSVETDDTIGIEFEFEVNSYFEIAECGLIINNEIVQSNSGNSSFLVDLDIRDYEWKIKCVDIYGHEKTSEIRSLYIEEESSGSSNNHNINSNSNNYYKNLDYDSPTKNPIVSDPIIAEPKYPEQKESFFERIINWLKKIFWFLDFKK